MTTTGTTTGARKALFTGAMAILLVGAATAGVFGYLTIVRGTPAAMTTGAAARR